MNIKSPWLSDGIKSRSKGHAEYRAHPNKAPGECVRCKGLGKLILGDGRAVWKCYSCNGTGRQTEVDILRNVEYNMRLDAKAARISAGEMKLSEATPQPDAGKITLSEAVEQQGLLVRVCLDKTCGHTSVVELQKFLDGGAVSPDCTIAELERRSICSRCDGKHVRVVLQSIA